MKYTFTLPEFPNSNFEIESSIWTGKKKLWMDGRQLEQTKEWGKPFLIPSENGPVKAFPKQNLPDFAPALMINGTKRDILPKLPWYQIVLGGLPICLLFIGGAVGGAIGALGTFISFGIFRGQGAPAMKYLKVAGIVILSYLLYIVVAMAIHQSLQ